MSTKHDFEYAIKWEKLRSAYFRTHGKTSQADECTKTLSELQWRYAMLPSTDQKETTITDGFVDSEWITAAEPMTNAGSNHEMKEPMAA